MSLKTILFDAGPESGAVTTGNSGLSTVSLSGGTCVYKAAAALDGSFGIEMASTASNTAILRGTANGANNAFAAEVGFNVITHSATTNETIIALRNSTPGYALRINISNTGTLYMSDAAGANNVTIKTGLTTATSYRISIVVNVSTGAYAVKLYPGNSLTIVSGASISSTGYNVGAATINVVELTDTNTAVVRYDSLQMNDGGTTEIGPYAAPANVAPTVNAGSDQHLVGSQTAALSGTVADSDGTVNSASWTLISGPDAPTVSSVASPSLPSASSVVTSNVAVTPGTYRFRLTATDNSAASTTDDVFVYVAAASNADVVPLQEISGTYTKVGASATRLSTVITNVAPSTQYLESAAAPAADAERFQWNPFNTGALTFYVGGYQNPSSPAVTITVNVYKEDGSTLVYTDSFSAPTSNAEHAVVLDGTALALIPGLIDRRALITQISATQ